MSKQLGSFKFTKGEDVLEFSNTLRDFGHAALHIEEHLKDDFISIVIYEDTIQISFMPVVTFNNTGKGKQLFDSSE